MGLFGLESNEVRHILVALGYILSWYTFSIGITFYNKWLFRVYGLEYPLFVTMCHTFATFAFAGLARFIREKFYGLPKTTLAWRDILCTISTAGVTGAMDIGLSNLSIDLIPITLYTMCKSTVVVWLLLFAFIFKLEKPTPQLIGVIAMISGGLIVFRAKEGVSVDSIGFMLIMSASILGGLRWVLTQMVLHKEKDRLGLKHPVDTVYYVSPCMGITLLPFALGIEGSHVLSSPLLFGAPTLHTFLSSLLYITFGATLAFGLTLSEFMLVNHTSGLALSVAGIFKEVCTIVLAVLVMPDDHLTGLNVLGLVVSIIGIMYYNYLKYTQAVSPSKYERLPNPQDSIEMDELSLSKAEAAAHEH